MAIDQSLQDKIPLSANEKLFMHVGCCTINSYDIRISIIRFRLLITLLIESIDYTLN